LKVRTHNNTESIKLFPVINIYFTEYG